MSAELITAFGVALATIIAAIGALWLKLRSLNHHLNSRLDLLLRTVEEKAFSAGGAAERARASGQEAPPTHPKGRKSHP